jgi:hypothetical protein
MAPKPAPKLTKKQL